MGADTFHTRSLGDVERDFTRPRLSWELPEAAYEGCGSVDSYAVLTRMAEVLRLRWKS